MKGSDWAMVTVLGVLAVGGVVTAVVLSSRGGAAPGAAVTPATSTRAAGGAQAPAPQPPAQQNPLATAAEWVAGAGDLWRSINSAFA